MACLYQGVHHQLDRSVRKHRLLLASVALCSLSLLFGFKPGLPFSLEVRFDSMACIWDRTLQDSIGRFEPVDDAEIRRVRQHPDSYR